MVLHLAHVLTELSNVKVWQLFYAQISVVHLATVSCTRNLSNHFWPWHVTLHQQFYIHWIIEFSFRWNLMVEVMFRESWEALNNNSILGVRMKKKFRRICAPKMFPNVPNLFPASKRTPSAGEGQSSTSRSAGRSHPYERSQGAWLLKFVDYLKLVTAVFGLHCYFWQILDGQMSQITFKMTFFWWK